MSAEWSAIVGDRPAWDAATATIEAAEEALAWLTDSILDVDRQLADCRAELANRMPREDYADLMDWRARAIGFKRICESRKRALAPRVKAARRTQADAERASYLAERGHCPGCRCGEGLQ